jgi:NAD-dependent SIR2 family protein deacetylase
MAAQIVDTSVELAGSASQTNVLVVGGHPHQGQCTRCGGLMVADRYIDLLDDTGKLEFTADRCIQCGEVVDQTILRNRMSNQARTAAAPLAQVA